MTRKQLLFLGTSILLFILAMAIDYSSFLSPSMEVYKQRLETDLHERERKVSSIFKDKEFLSKILSQNPNTENYSHESDVKKLANIAASNYTLHIYNEAKELVYWSNNTVDFSQHHENINKDLPRFDHLPNGYYEIIRTPLLLDGVGKFTGIGLIPIKYDYKLESKYLLQKFFVNVPEQINISIKPSDFDLRSRDDTRLCYLSTQEPLQDIKHVRYTFGAYLLAFFVLALFVNETAKLRAQKTKLWAGLAILMGTAFGLKWIGSIFGFTEKFKIFPIFQPAPDSFALSNSLGDLIINILLLLWITIFVHRQYEIPSYQQLSQGRKTGLVFIQSFGIVLAIIQVCYVFKELIYDSGIDFHFQNVFNLGELNLEAILGVILLLITLFLFSHLMMKMILRVGLPRVNRQIVYCVAAAAGIPVSLFFNLDLSVIWMAVLLIGYIGAFDFYIDSETNLISTFNPMTILVLWLVGLGAFSSLLLYQYNKSKEEKSRLKFAQALVNDRDAYAEQAIKDLRNQLISNDVLSNLIAPHNIEMESKKVRAEVDRYFANISYLFNNYSYMMSSNLIMTI